MHAKWKVPQSKIQIQPWDMKRGASNFGNFTTRWIIIFCSVRIWHNIFRPQHIHRKVLHFVNYQLLFLSKVCQIGIFSSRQLTTLVTLNVQGLHYLCSTLELQLPLQFYKGHWKKVTINRYIIHYRPETWDRIEGATANWTKYMSRTIHHN
jgi:hypothetical protein